MTDSDQRRKLDLYDYQRTVWQVNNGYTIRDVANEHSISTKYVKKIMAKPINETAIYIQVENSGVTFDCSGCGRFFALFDTLQSHFTIWTSGSNPLSCASVMPR